MLEISKAQTEIVWDGSSAVDCSYLSDFLFVMKVASMFLEVVIVFYYCFLCFLFQQMTMKFVHLNARIWDVGVHLMTSAFLVEIIILVSNVSTGVKP